MCYVVMKDFNSHGCVAHQTHIGKELKELAHEMNQLASHKGIEIVVVSRSSAYGEYAPHSFVETEDELEGTTLAT